MQKIMFQRIAPFAKLPSKAHPTDACFDLYCPEDYAVGDCETVVIPLGVRAIIPEGYHLQFEEKSGLASKGIVIGAGVVDSAYTGELKAVVRFFNPTKLHSKNWYNFKAGDKVVQAKLVKDIPTEIEEISDSQFNELAKEKDRGSKGFGSSGR